MKRRSLGDLAGLPLVLGLALSFVAAHASAQAQDSANAKTHKAIEHAVAGLMAAIARGDAAAIAAFYGEDVRVVQSGVGTAEGRAQVRDMWERSFAQTSFANPQMTITRLTVSGALAVAAGTATIVAQPKNDTKADTLALPYLAAWARQADGRWLLRDLMLASPSQPNR